MDFKLISKLTGHSGCEIFIIDFEGKQHVLKISSSIDYNDRLKSQMLKQKSFSDQVIFSPKIITEGFDKNNLQYFIMEFVNGISFNDYIRIKPFDQSKKIFYKLLDFIARNNTNKIVDKKEIIDKKVEEVLKNIQMDINFRKPKELECKIPSGFCHGDLTFENILISKKGIYLIDFLDSYLESPLIDFSKLYQDLILNWSNRYKESDSLTLIRLNHLRKILDDFLIFQNQNISAIEYQRKLTLLRILPYSTKISTYLNIINNI